MFNIHVRYDTYETKKRHVHRHNYLLTLRIVFRGGITVGEKRPHLCFRVHGASQSQ